MRCDRTCFNRLGVDDGAERCGPPARLRPGVKRRTFLGAAAASALPLPAIAQPERNRVLKFVPQAALSALDPIWTTAAVTTNCGFYVFETLFAVDSALKPLPQMAEGAVASDDGRSWTVKLREGLRFHDGTPVRAVDCAASLKRWAAKDTFGQSLAGVVDEWVATDDRTLTIKLKQPFPLLPFALGKPAANVPFIMPERLAQTDPAKQVTELVGSGPYRFLPDQFVSGARAAWARFDAYVPRQEAPSWFSGGKVAHFDRIEWQVIPDAATAFAALKTGEVDWWEQVQPDMVGALKTDRNVQIGPGDPTGYVGVMRFNHLQPPFNNPKLCHAILQAVNQADYMGAVTGGDATAYKICHSMYPCSTPYGVVPQPDPMPGKPDLDRSRQLVKESGYNGEKVVIINPSDFATIEPFGQITYDLLRRLGMNVELQETDWGTVVQRRNNREPVDKGGWSIFHTWWNGISITLPATNSIERGQGEKGWFGWYTNPKIESLVTEWLTAPDDATRQRLGMDVQVAAFQDVPTVPLGQFFIRTAMRSDLTGLVEGPAPIPWGLRRA